MLNDNNNYFELFGYSIFNVATGSMEPTISQNDVILVKKQDHYKLNDIITFKKDKDFITHRIIKINDTYITTKGDANNAIDVAITQDVIIGKVIKIYENAGIWQKILTTPQVVVMIFVTLILFDLAFSYKGFKNKQLVKQVDQIDLEQVAKKSHDFKFNKEEIKALYNKMDLIKKNKDIDLNEICFIDNTAVQAKWVDLKELYNMIENGEIAWVLIPRIEEYVIPLMKETN